MYNDINNPKGFMFVNEDDSGGIPNAREAMSNSSGHKSSAPTELWGDDAYVLPIKQKDATPTPKKHEEKEKINPLKKQEGETQEQWAKRMRDSTDAINKKYSDKAKQALSKLHDIEQGGEEENHEPPNQFVKDTRRRKSTFTDDDNKKYLIK